MASAHSRPYESVNFGPPRLFKETGATTNSASAGACVRGVPMEVRVLQVATVGENPDAVFVGIRSFPVTRLILLHTPEFANAAREVAHRAAGVKIQVSLHRIDGDPLLGCLRLVSEIVATERSNYDEIIVNTGGGPRMMTCSLLAAAFVNGVRAIDVMGDHPIALPVLKFSYTELVSDAKLDILRTLEKMGGEANSLEELVQATKMDKSLLSYHIRGGRGAKGLEELGLIEVLRGVQGRLGLRLTATGKLLLIGRVPAAPAPAPVTR